MLSLFCSGHCLQELVDYSMDMLPSCNLHQMPIYLGEYLAAIYGAAG